jgi:hypothetical protein
MSESYKQTYNYNEYEFDIIKRADNVIIICLDKQLYKSYQEIFTSDIIANIFSVNNSNDFIQIIDFAFKNNSFTVIPELSKLNIEINYSNVLDFKFNILLHQNEQSQLNANSIYIKKLEERIDELENLILLRIGNFTYKSNYIPLLVSLKINELIINTSNNSHWIEISNAKGHYYYSHISYNPVTRILYIEPINHSPTGQITPEFFKLKPKKVTFTGTNINSYDKSMFPNEWI